MEWRLKTQTRLKNSAASCRVDDDDDRRGRPRHSSAKLRLFSARYLRGVLFTRRQVTGSLPTGASAADLERNQLRRQLRDWNSQKVRSLRR